MNIFIIVIGVLIAFTSLAQAAGNGKAIVELLVIVDNKAKDYYTDTPQDQVKSKITHEVKYMLTETNKLYRRLLNNNLDIELRLKRLEILDTDLFPSFTISKFGRVDQREALFNLMLYLTSKRNDQDYSHDMALLYTGYWFEGQTLGIANLDKMCSNTSDATVVISWRRETEMVHLSAHEIGHMLGLPHDQGNCSTVNRYVMYPFATNRQADKFAFSPCSIALLQKNISNIPCLYSTNPSSEVLNTKAPMEFYDMEKMCQLSGRQFMCKSFKEYGGKAPEGDIVCQYVACGDEYTSFCPYISATEGMVCAEGKRCEFGKCITAPRDFPVPSNVKNGCVFGDQAQMTHPLTTTCPAYFAADPSRKSKCNENGTYSQCCETCQRLSGTPSGTTAAPTRGDCPGTDHPNCRDHPRDLMCAANKDRCCNYCKDWQDPNPIVGKRHASSIGRLPGAVHLPDANTVRSKATMVDDWVLID